MTAGTENLLIEILKPIRTDVADMKGDIADLKTRATAVNEHNARRLDLIEVK